MTFVCVCVCVYGCARWITFMCVYVRAHMCMFKDDSLYMYVQIAHFNVCMCVCTCHAIHQHRHARIDTCIRVSTNMMHERLIVPYRVCVHACI